MSKQTGLGWTTLSVDDALGSPVVIKNDVNTLDFSTPRGVIETTGVDKSAYERLLGLADFSIKLDGTFNAATSHTVFATTPSTSVARTVSLTVGGVSLPNETLFTDYSIKRDKDGALTWEAPGVLADGTVPTWA